MNVKYIFALAFAIFCLSSAAFAQDKTAIYGRVIGSDQGNEAPEGWVVQVTAIRVDTGQRVDQRDSSRDLYCVFVPTNSIVRLTFATSFHKPGELGYGAQRGRPIDTSPDDRHPTYRAQPDIILSRRIVHEGANARGLVQQELNADLDIARETGSLDILGATFTSYREAYQSNQAIIADINSTEAGSLKDPLRPDNQFQRMLNELQQPSLPPTGRVLTPIDPTKILRFVEDKTIFPDVRSQVLQALTTYYSGPATQSVTEVTVLNQVQRKPPQEVLFFFRKQLSLSSSDLLLTSMIALAKLGDANDRQLVVNSVLSEDVNRARAAVIAIGEGRLAQGVPALTMLLRQESQPELERLALRSLAQLYQLRSDDVMTAFRQAVLSDSQLYVRMSAAEALGAIDSASAQKLLKEVEKNDKSPGVRAAATTSLQRARP